MAQVLNSDAQLLGHRIHMANAALANTFTGLNPLSGSLQLANQPRALLRNVGLQSIAHDVETPCTFNTEIVDIGGMHDSVNSSRVTIPTGQGGVYLLVGSVEFEANTSGTRRCRFDVNGATSGPRVIQTADQATLTNLRITELLSLSAGDFVEFVVRQTSGVTLDIGHLVDPVAQTAFRVVKLF